VGLGARWNLSGIHYAVGPCEFLGLVRDASVIVTNSFHGTAFAIIYRRPFYCCLNGNDGDARMLTLLETLGLSSHIARNWQAFADGKVECEADFAACADILSRKREEAFRYLTGALSLEVGRTVAQRPAV
jgi:hypothetical protein